MPLHDWTRVDSGVFHDFHQRWMVALSNALNDGALPSDYFAMVEQRIAGPIADVLTLEIPATSPDFGDASGGVAVAAAPPRTDITRKTEASAYAARASRVTVRHRHGRVIAVVEIVSPGNKDSQAAFRAFVKKSADLVEQGVHLLVVDPFPPGRRDANGVQQAIWAELADEELPFPGGDARSLGSYDAGGERVAYASFAHVGQPLPEMPLFLRPGIYVPAPLEASYQSAWSQFPNPLRRLLGESPRSA